MIESLPKLMQSRKLFVLTGILSVMGIWREGNNNSDFSFFILLLFLGCLASIMSIILLTKMKNREKDQLENNS